MSEEYSVGMTFYRLSNPADLPRGLLLNCGCPARLPWPLAPLSRTQEGLAREGPEQCLALAVLHCPAGPRDLGRMCGTPCGHSTSRAGSRTGGMSPFPLKFIHCIPGTLLWAQAYRVVSWHGLCTYILENALGMLNREEITDRPADAVSAIKSQNEGTVWVGGTLELSQGFVLDGSKGWLPEKPSLCTDHHDGHPHQEEEFTADQADIWS